MIKLSCVHAVLEGAWSIGIGIARFDAFGGARCRCRFGVEDIGSAFHFVGRGGGGGCIRVFLVTVTARRAGGEYQCKSRQTTTVESAVARECGLRVSGQTITINV